MDDFIKDRNEAFASMDEEKIRAYCAKYDIAIPEESNEIFWAGVHKTVCNLFLLENSPISVEQYNKSYDWLIEHGYHPSIINDEEEV